MKIFTTLLLAIIAHFSVAQISFFKELNTQEEGSSPANFTEVNGITFFSVKTLDGYNLWKTDGTEAGTVVVSTQSIDIHITGYGVPNFQVLNNELYYYVQKPQTLYAQPLELWKTDGTNNTLIASEIPIALLYYLNNTICYQTHQGFFKIEGGISIKVKDFGTSYIYTNEPPVLFNNQLIFYTGQFPRSGENILQIWKTDGTESGTTIISNIDRLVTFNPGIYEHEKLSLKIDNQVYFVVKRISIDRYKVNVELWKTNGIETVFIKEISNYDYYYDDNTYSIASKLTNFNGKLLFNFYSDIWLSDGTSNGTTKVKTIQSFTYGSSSGKWGILNDKFYFAGFNGTNANGYDFELWQSDGTTAGTVLLKDINPTSSSGPNYFTTINNKLFFKANNDELWQSDGTETGTTFVLNIPKPANSADSYRVTPEFVYTSNNQLYFSNYDATNDFELWKSDGTMQNTGLLKNITTRSKGSGISGVKIKVENIWYFSATDHRGTELWKSDGTPEGTTIVKDITAGGFSTFIREMVAVGNVVYFTANTTNDNTTKLYRTDGTEAGTVELVLNSPTPVNPKSLVATENKLFFTSSYTLWVSDGVNSNPINLSAFYGSTPSNITRLPENKVMFISNGLCVSDGTETGTFKVFGNDFHDVPQNPVCLLDLNNKVYFFSSFFNSQSNTTKYALFESDGTRVGTKVVREFSESDKLTNSYLLFLEKSANRLYFRAGYNSNYGSQYFDLWTSDGTETGTYKLKSIPFTGSFNFKFASTGNQFYMFLMNQVFGGGVALWTSNGTVEGTNQVFQYPTSSVGTSSISFNNKLYFNLFDNNYGLELWTTNGTNNGTYLVEEVRPSAANSYVSNLMNFDEKLLFWASDNTRSSELWQYLPANCEGNRNYTILSGNWDSSSTWSCGTIPSQDDIIIIKSGHTITIPDNFQTTIKGISTENGAVLTIPQSAIFTVNPR